MSRLPASVGTLGAGNMAEAILRGVLQAGFAPEKLIASDPDEARREHIRETLGVRATADNDEVIAQSDLVVLAVKPQALADVTSALTLPERGGPLFLSIAAGQRLDSLRRMLGANARVTRAMPNTPALIGAGITALAEDPATDAADLDRAEAVLSAVGRVVRVPEALLDPVTGLSGSGPAYVYRFIEVLCEAGVREGLPEDVTRELVVQTVLGAAAMVRDGADSPATLRDRVTSPGGTTAAGLAALSEHDFREAVLEAVRAATARSKELADES